MREEIRKAGLPIRIRPEGNGLVLEAERPDLADLHAVTNALAGQEAVRNRRYARGPVCQPSGAFILRDGRCSADGAGGSPGRASALMALHRPEPGASGLSARKCR